MIAYDLALLLSEWIRSQALNYEEICCLCSQVICFARFMENKSVKFIMTIVEIRWRMFSLLPFVSWRKLMSLIRLILINCHKIMRAQQLGAADEMLE